MSLAGGGPAGCCGILLARGMCGAGSKSATDGGPSKLAFELADAGLRSTTLASGASSFGSVGLSVELPGLDARFGDGSWLLELLELVALRRRLDLLGLTGTSRDSAP